MRPMRVFYRLRRDDIEETAVEEVGAYVLLCQDATEEYSVFRGPCDDVTDLFLWGMLNYTIGSPLPELVRAVDRVLRPASAKITVPSDIELYRPGFLDKRPPKPDVHGPWTMDFTIAHDHAKRIALNGATDALLFMRTMSGERKAFVGGSGTQKSKLIEGGVEQLFGRAVYDAFIKDYRGDESSFMRRFREEAIRRTRRTEGGNGIRVIPIVLPVDEDE